MACRISEVVLKCHDSEVLARFWCEVLDFIELNREGGGLHRDRSARRVRRPAADDLPHPQRRAEERACPAAHRRQPHRPRSGRRARAPPGRRGQTRRHRSACGGVLARPRRSRRQRVLPAQAPPRPTLTALAQTIDLGVVGPVDVRPSGQLRLGEPGGRAQRPDSFREGCSAGGAVQITV